MIDLTSLDPQYVTDETGRKTAVILPLEKFNDLLDDIEDLAALAERREEPVVGHGDVIAELKRDGLLRD